MMEGPLTELRNQRLPRRKMAQTYGKKKASGMSTAHRELFGSDENKIEEKIEDSLANLNIKTPKSGVSDSKTSARTDRCATPKDSVIARAPATPGHSLVSEEDASAVKPLLKLSGLKIELFSTVGDKLARTMHIAKVGEGSYAEVFKLSPKINNSISSSSSQQAIQEDGTIIKVIPLNHPSANTQSGERLSHVSSVAREIRILQTLDSIHGFTRFRGIRLVTGSWPKSFLDAFRTFKRACRARAFNSPPAEDFTDKQIYAIVEMGDAGTEISILKKPNVFQIFDILWNTAVILAHAEERVEFEHRDLHVSNICVKPLAVTNCVDEETNDETSTSTATSTIPDIDHALLANMTESNVPTTKLGLANIKVTLIDYTITRCVLSQTNTFLPSMQDIAYDPMRFINGLDPSTTDKWEEQLQYHTYLKCKAAVEHNPSTNPVHSKWRQFIPRTNVMWLAYLLQLLSRRAHGRTRKYYIVKGSSGAATQLQRDMWDVLEEVQDVLCGVDLADSDDKIVGRAARAETGWEVTRTEVERTPASAIEFLARAVESGWIGQGEVDALMARFDREA